MEMKKLIIKNERLDNGYYTMAEVCEIIGLHYHNFRYAVKTGTVPRPSKKYGISPKNYYDRADLELIRKAAVIR